MAQLLRCTMLKAMRFPAAEMPNPKQILVAIDDFQSARHLVDYVGELVRGHDDFKIHLFHAAGPLPPNYQNHRERKVPPQNNTSSKSKSGNKRVGSTELATKSNLNAPAKNRGDGGKCASERN